MNVGKIRENKPLMEAIKEIREKVYNDISAETRQEFKTKYADMTEEELEVIKYFLEPGLYFNFYLNIK